MIILGLSCFYHDAAACILKDGELIAACQEERFSRIKHDWRFPESSIAYCLREANVSIDEVDAVAFYEKPLLKFERVLETFLAVAPRGIRAFVDVMPSWLQQKFWLPHILKKKIGYDGTCLYFPHHVSHAASAYFLSPFDAAAILTIDGVGEWATASYGIGRGSKIDLTHEMLFPNSIGLLYSTVTAYLGFSVNNDEYKVMGMAPYGKPDHAGAMLKHLCSLKQDGSIQLNMKYFNFQYGRTMYDRRQFQRLFGMLPRKRGEEITAQHYAIAASIQQVTEAAVIAMAKHVRLQTGMKNLCLAGGVALNSVANGKLLRERLFDDIFVQPAAGDAGGAVGAAYAAYHHVMNRKDRHPLRNLYLGPAYNDGEIQAVLERHEVHALKLEDEKLFEAAAAKIADGKIVGWHRGRMEFGPRALGNRSIFADPRRPDMKDLINSKVKFRESFRPFAPAVKAEKAGHYFQTDRPSPFMLFTVPVLNDAIPAVTHVDGSARVQTVDSGQNPDLYALLTAFERITGVPVLLNTSLNVRGEPIALTPADAVGCLAGSGMDVLVLGNYLCYKER